MVTTSSTSNIFCALHTDINAAVKSQNTVKPNPLCRLPGKFWGSRRNGISAKGDVTACRGCHGKSA